jgi:dipeptidyl aminopeptidase/acylaminoacyl peptidase
LVRVRGDGGQVETILGNDSMPLYQPRSLPGGHGLVALAQEPGGRLSVVLVDLKSRTWHRVDETAGQVAVSPPHYLLYNRGRFLMGAVVDVNALELAGPPVPVLEAPSGDFGWFKLRGGTLLYQSASLGGNLPVLVNRRGERRALSGLPERQSYGFPAVSPDGRKIAFRMNPAGGSDAQMDVWVYELPDGPLTRLTFEGRDDDPSWTPDGKRILFDSDREGGNALWAVPWDGSGAPERILDRTDGLYRTSWLPGGREFLFDERKPNGSSDIGIAPVDQPDSARLLLSNPYAETWPAISPDGRWLAYQSNESGQEEIYVRPFRGEGTRRQVSRRGGTSPVWSRGGRELFFEGLTGDSLFGAELDVGADAAVQRVQSLFALRRSALGFDVFPGDSVFIVFDPPEAAGGRAARAIVVHNFIVELETRLGAPGK